jgi:hypothetical protein
MAVEARKLVWSDWGKKKAKYKGKSDLSVWNCEGDQCNAIGYGQE